MRICLFTSTFLPRVGGHETVVDELARTLNRAGNEAVVLAQHASVTGTYGKLDVPYRVVRFRKPFSQMSDLGALERALLRLHRKWPFDILHSHSSYPTGYVAVEVGKQLKLPVVVTPHGGDIAETSRFRDRPVVRQRIRQTLERADAVTILSAYMRDRALLASPASSSRFVSIPNGIHLDWFLQPKIAPREIAAEIHQAGGNYFLFLGRLHPRKGVDVLIKSFQTVANKIPATSLVIAGKGTEENALREQVEKSGLARRIHFVGSVQGENKLSLLQNALCVVTPTKTWEAFCVVVTEAMASGIPVIGSRVGGIVDLISPGEDGLIVSANSTDELGDALVTMASDPNAREKMSRNGREKAKRYDWPLVAEMYLSLFRDLLRKRNQSGEKV